MVCNLLRIQEIPVFDADREAKTLNDTSPEVRTALTRHFGNDLYEGEKLNRQKLAELIFNDRRNLSMANSIIHPALAERFSKWCQERDHEAFVAIDAAVLFEAGFERLVDTVITVYAPKEIRVKRVLKREHIETEQVEARMLSQMPEEEKIKRANHVIYNDGRHSLIQQVADFLVKVR